MTNNNHPITPPDDLQEQWKQEWLRVRPAMTPFIQWMLAKSARWGADQELEACCEHLKPLMSPRATIDYLRAARRPKALSLKEQALKELAWVDKKGAHKSQLLEAIYQLENNND
jgi:hypothetical protein